MMKKAPEILAYKGKLIERIEYHLEGGVALIHIPWNEIEVWLALRAQSLPPITSKGCPAP